jgi:hypothetical protein
MKILQGIIAAFNRRYVHAKIANKRNKVDGDTVVFTTSRLTIKREMTKEHVNARLYKRAMRGIVGAMTWAQLDALLVLKDNGKKSVRPPAQLPRQVRRKAWLAQRKIDRAAWTSFNAARP